MPIYSPNAWQPLSVGALSHCKDSPWCFEEIGRSVDVSCGRILRGKVSQHLVWLRNFGYVVAVRDFVIDAIAICSLVYIEDLCSPSSLINSLCSQWHS